MTRRTIMNIIYLFILCTIKQFSSFYNPVMLRINSEHSILYKYKSIRQIRDKIHEEKGEELKEERKKGKYILEKL